MNRKGDQLMQVDMSDQAMVAIGGFGKMMRLPSR